jgi:branched-chain amino acid transport system ATP-binding protein
VPHVLVGEDISVSYGGIAALAGVSLEVPEQAIVGLIGPNGAGKSTLLGVLSGLIEPGAGKVMLNGEDVTSRSAHERARRGIARTFQQPELFAGLSVREHLVLAWRIRFDRQRMWRDLIDGRAWRRSSPREDERIGYLLDRLGLSALRDADVTGLPLGYSRLLEIGRALASEPSVVLLDEPFSGLDANGLEAVGETLQDLVLKDGLSLLLVDHDVDTVLARSAKVVVLDFGHVIAEGTPGQIRDNEVVRAAYLGGNADISSGSNHA